MSTLASCLFPLGAEGATRARGACLTPGAGLNASPGVSGALVVGGGAGLALQAALTRAAGGGRAVVVVGGARWDQLPPTVHGMPGPTAAAMAAVTFLYPASLGELTGLLAGAAADTVVVAEAELLVRRSMEAGEGEAWERTFLRTFARMSAILQGFLATTSTSTTSKEQPASLAVFARLTEQEEAAVAGRAVLWYSEVWREEVHVTHCLLTCSSSRAGMALR